MRSQRVRAQIFCTPLTGDAAAVAAHAAGKCGSLREEDVAVAVAAAAAVAASVP